MLAFLRSGITLLFAIFPLVSNLYSLAFSRMFAISNIPIIFPIFIFFFCFCFYVAQMLKARKYASITRYACCCWKDAVWKAVYVCICICVCACGRIVSKLKVFASAISPILCFAAAFFRPRFTPFACCMFCYSYFYTTIGAFSL